MSFNELEESIKNLDDLVEVPQLRARIKELEAELHRCNQKHEQKESAWIKEKRARARTPTAPPKQKE